jgi:hypothetical protein
MLLVLQQFLGYWQINNPHLRSLCEEASELANNFHSVNVQHIPRVFKFPLSQLDIALWS